MVTEDKKLKAYLKLTYKPSQEEIDAWQAERPKCWDAHNCVTWGCASGTYSCRRKRK